MEYVVMDDSEISIFDLIRFFEKKSQFRIMSYFYRL